MSTISINNLTFAYDYSSDIIFNDLSLNIDTNWKLGFIGRNGKGKTTFLNLLLGKYEYKGKIIADVNFEYFPYEIENPELNSYEISKKFINEYEEWKLEREISLLDMDSKILNQKFCTLSKGEQTKVLLAMMFLKENNYLLIDEPTNHLDTFARKSLANYLKKKKSFILVSHDRALLDEVVDHILAINRNDIVIEKGNFSTWYENKLRQDNFELNENTKLKKEINRLEASARQASTWSDKVETSKHHMAWDGAIDKGFIGHKAAKMMKRSTLANNRREKAIADKSKLLKNIEVVEDLKLTLLPNRKGKLIDIKNLSIKYGDNVIFDNISFSVEDGDRVQLKGKNGCGKSSIIKLILGENISYTGDVYIMNNLKMSYISQDTTHLNGSLKKYIEYNDIDEVLFKAILRKLDFERDQFDKDLASYSEGQKKKVLIAKSLCDKANIYIWDEPLNYIDIFSRIQIENLILKYKPTMIFVEHDESFAGKIATKRVLLYYNFQVHKNFYDGIDSLQHRF